jgi:hypothetical protein
MINYPTTPKKEVGTTPPTPETVLSNIKTAEALGQSARLAYLIESAKATQ